MEGQKQEGNITPERMLADYRRLHNLCAGAYMYEHGLAHPTTEYPSPEASMSVVDMRQKIEEFIQEICDRYGLVRPDPNIGFLDSLPEPPEGKTYLGDWCREQWKADMQQKLSGAPLEPIDLG